MPTPAAAVAPTSNWPSPPMLNRPTASGIVKPSARSVSGTHFVRVSVKPKPVRNDVVKIVRYASIGS